MTRRPPPARATATSPWDHVWPLAGVAAAAVVAFWPVLQNDFVNWDDQAVILQNQELSKAGLLHWAFTTTLIGHYQPLAWLSWAAMTRLFGTNPRAFHAVSLAGHTLNAVLVYLIAWRVTSLSGVDQRVGRLAAFIGALLFALHPVRVEAVAWASAFPYVLSTAALLAAFLIYLQHQETSAAWLLVLAVVAYAVSLLARPVAIAFPLVLLAAADAYPLRRTIDRRVVIEKLPFAALAVAAAAAESRAREVASLQDVGIGARLTMAVAAPFTYLARTALPIQLNPLDPLPIAPAADWSRIGLAVAALAIVAAIVWQTRHRWPALAAGSIVYVLLLAPVVGLIPSGLQATADRYMYLPGVVVALLVGIAVARVWPANRFAPAAFVAALAVIASFGVLTWRQTALWHDSITLWTRAADLDPRNDIATYNLAIALADAGKDDEAIGRYEQTIRLIPDHALARKNMDALRARQAEREGDRLADADRLVEAERQYSRALDLDSTRLHARAARGIVLVRLGRAGEAVADLRTATDARVQDAPVVNAFAFSLMETGRFAEAAAVLRQGVDRYPDDVDLAHNLARLLATAPDARVRDGPRALGLALAVRDRTGGSDPRALDTLAAAYAATDQIALARDTADLAAARARELGDETLAVEIAAHARTYRR